jgi:guanine deaminase
VRGSVLHFLADPAETGEAAHQYLDDGLLVIADGRVAALGTAAALLPTLPPGAAVTDYSGRLIVPGFIDTHVHYSQLDVIASPGTELLEWLDRYTFPAERRFADPAHARAAARFFLDELLRNGTTTAMVFATVHEHSVDAVFEAAAERGACLIAGKVMMDRNCPEFLRDTAQSSYDASAALIRRWHGRGRLRYAVTPRFAPTSTERQLELAGRLLDEHPGVHFQSHLAESRAELAWVAELFPWSRTYLDVYDRFGLVRPRAVYAHCLHLDRADRTRLADSGAAISFCPTSNLFLGSGLFDLGAARETGARIGIGTDVGAGTSLGMLRTLHDAYTVARLGGQSLAPLQAYYLATLGAARALCLEDRIGSFAVGRDADFAVLDWAATPLMARRMASAGSLAERLFVLMMLGDDRAVVATHLGGRPAYQREQARGS